jgi:hypothetical protein
MWQKMRWRSAGALLRAGIFLIFFTLTAIRKSFRQHPGSVMGPMPQGKNILLKADCSVLLKLSQMHKNSVSNGTEVTVLFIMIF